METHEYTCDYCKKKYIPTRRGAQRFCKRSCSTVFHRNEKKKEKEEERQLQLASPELVQVENVSLEKPLEDKNEKKMKVEKMTVAGVGNSFAGSALYDAVKGIAKLGQMEENKLATKGDITKVLNQLERYQPIAGLPFNEFGQQPYFDMETKKIVYKGLINPFTVGGNG